MVNVKAGDIKFFWVAAGRVVDRLGGLYLLNCDAGYRADAGALVAADAVFGEKVEPVVAIFGHGSFFMGIGEGYAATGRGFGALPDSRGPSPNCLH